ncbi:hypothetical protein X798_04503 [Onchocerca flexuosa]|uniref:RING-type domain-containing protein n=1 Tax=Onchocerca flexuosa TaxID=387005 RepID=A0A238BT21_9BILA|nr:hypothetical protein X798_04503 [Onchocerca flexuosa]
MVSIGSYEISYEPSLLSTITDNNGPSLCQERNNIKSQMVCFEPFKQNICIPKLLPCGHSFCHICITALKLNSIYICKCPLCRYSFPLRYDTNFPINYSLLVIIVL